MALPNLMEYLTAQDWRPDTLWSFKFIDSLQSKFGADADSSITLGNDFTSLFPAFECDVDETSVDWTTVPTFAGMQSSISAESREHTITLMTYDNEKNTIQKFYKLWIDLCTGKKQGDYLAMPIVKSALKGKLSKLKKDRTVDYSTIYHVVPSGPLVFSGKSQQGLTQLNMKLNIIAESGG